jgi:predicted secreted protein
MKKISLEHEKITEEIEDGINSVAVSKRGDTTGIFPLLEEHAHLGGNEHGVQKFVWRLKQSETGEITEKTYEVPGDPKSWTPHLWEYFIVSLNVRGNILDVGSGIGYAAWWFDKTSKGLFETEGIPDWEGLEVTAIEGLPYNVKNAVHPTRLVDLSKESYVPKEKFNLIWSCEVAEHIDESAIDFYLDTISNTKILAMTAAPPGDGGHHHVNCQLPDYWIDKLRDKGMRFSFELTVKARERAACLAPGQKSHFGRNGLIFVDEDTYEMLLTGEWKPDHGGTVTAT